MVAISSSRRTPSTSPSAPRCEDQTYPLTPLAQPPEDWETVASSRRDSLELAVQRDSTGEVVSVQIGHWRTINASQQRRIAEVTELACQRIAVRFDMFHVGSRTKSSVVWQLFDRRGRLLASMQLTADGQNALLTSYETRNVCRLVRDDAGELRNVEQWRM